MKKVLVLNGDSYVGRHVVRAFYQSYEYDVEITLTQSDERAATTAGAVAKAAAQNWVRRQTKGVWESLSLSWGSSLAKSGDGSGDATPAPGARRRSRKRGSSVAASAAEAFADPDAPPPPPRLSEKERQALPADIQYCVKAIVPKHNDNTEEFRTRLLANDVVIAVLLEDTYEAMCAIRILAGTHYDVEKTFVLVSSAVTWAYTLTAERTRARMTRRRERAEERAAYLDELMEAGEDEEGDLDEDDGGRGGAAAAERAARRAAHRAALEKRLPLSLREPPSGEDEAEIREQVPDRVFTDDAYSQRVPHPRFQHWHALEHLVKRSNTETLHTYVVFAGLPYGAGEGANVLQGLLRSAWHHQVLPQYGAGVNQIPLIYVQDLAAVLYKVGSAYDVLPERYLFAVDQGRVTQRQLLQAVQACLGGTVQPAVAPTAGATTSSALPFADLVHLDKLELPPPSTPEELFAAFGNTPCWGDGGALLTALVLSDIQAEPSTALTVHPEDEWVALNGFLANLDTVCAQFRAAHGESFKPVRALVTGPPLSGADAVAAAVAQRCSAPCLTRESIVAAYTAHVADVRGALRGLLMRRLQRRRDRVHARLVRQAADAREAARVAKVEAARQRRKERQEQRRLRQERRENGEEDDGDEDDADLDDAAAEPHSGGRSYAASPDSDGRSGDDSGENAAGSDLVSNASSMSIFLPPLARRPDEGEGGEDGEDDAEDDDVSQGDAQAEQDAAAVAASAQLRPVEEVVDETYIRGAAAAAAAAGGDDGGDEGDDGGFGIDEEQEEAEDADGEDGNWLVQLDARDEEAQAELQEDRELLPPPPEGPRTTVAVEEEPVQPRFAARRRGRAFARDVDQQELRCIAALRQEYLLGLKVLALRMSAADGKLPRPPPPPADEVDGDEDYDRDAGGARRRGGSGSDGDEEDDEEDEEGEGGDGESDGADHRGDAAGGGANDNDEEDARAEPPLSAAAAAAAVNPDLVLDRAEDGADYLDSALAVMCRWRLRQPDCRCQGYVLSDFPQTLAQAVLCFRANEAELESGELRRQRALAPLLARPDDQTALEEAGDVAGGGGDDDGATDLPPPLDADFPLPDVLHLEEEEVVALERAHRRGRGPTYRWAIAGTGEEDGEGGKATSAGGSSPKAETGDASPDAENILAPVDEGLYVDHVIAVQGEPAALRAVAEALLTRLDVEAEREPDADADGDASSATAALRELLHTTPYAVLLDWYQEHHAVAGRPTQSLLAWLGAVTTTAALGVRRAPVLVPPPQQHPGEDGDDVAGMDSGAAGGAGDAAAAAGADDADGSGGGAAVTTLEAPTTTRTAEVHLMPAPGLTTQEVERSWCSAAARKAAVFAEASAASAASPAATALAGHRVHAAEVADESGTAMASTKLPVALLRLAPRCWTGAAAPHSGDVYLGAPHCAGNGGDAAAVDASTASLAASLQPLAEDVCRRVAPARCVASSSSPAALPAPAVAPLSVLPAAGGLSAARKTPDSSFFAASPLFLDAPASSSTSAAADISSSAPKPTRVDKSVAAASAAGGPESLPAGAPDLEMSTILHELATLRRLQLVESGPDTASMLSLPSETYLMKYVLPNLTPTMTDVVRMRPNDPVLALADVLYERQRRVTL